MEGELCKKGARQEVVTAKEGRERKQEVERGDEIRGFPKGRKEEMAKAAHLGKD